MEPWTKGSVLATARQGIIQAPDVGATGTTKSTRLQIWMRAKYVVSSPVLVSHPLT